MAPKETALTGLGDQSRASLLASASVGSIHCQASFSRFSFGGENSFSTSLMKVV